MNHPIVFISYVVLWVLVISLIFAVFLLYWHYGAKIKRSFEERDRQGPALNKAVAPYLVLDKQHREFQLGNVNGAFQIVLFGISSTADSDFQAQLDRWVERSKGLVETVLIVANATNTDRYHNLPKEIVVIPDPELKVHRHWNIVQPSFVVLIDNQRVVRLKGLASTTKALGELYSHCGIPEPS